MTRLLAATVFAAFVLAGQERPRDPLGPDDHAGLRLPSGKLQQQELLKLDHEKSIKDAQQLIELAQSLKSDMEQSGENVLSVGNIKKTEEIEKIARRIRSRIKH